MFLVLKKLKREINIVQQKSVHYKISNKLRVTYTHSLKTFAVNLRDPFPAQRDM